MAKPVINTASKTICAQTIDLDAQTPIAREGVKGYWSNANVTWKADNKEGYDNVSTYNKVNVTLAPNSSTTFYWNVDVENQKECSKQSDGVVITNKYYEAKIETPSVKDYATCGSTVTLEAQNSESNYGVKGHWSWENSNVTLANDENTTYTMSDYKIVVKGLTPAATKFTWTVDDDVTDPDAVNCAPKEDYVSISNISVDANATVKVNCDHSATLTADVPKSGEGHWEFVSGSVLTAESMISGSTYDPKAYTITISGLKGGSYKYKWVVTTNDPNCSAEKEVSFEDNALTVFAQASAQTKNYMAQVCGDQYALSATAPKAVGATGKWTNTDGTPITDLSFVLGTSSDYSATIKGFTETGRTIRWTVTNPIATGATEACEFYDDITLTNNKPVADFTISTNGCDGKAELTASNMVSGDDAVYNGTWSKVSESYSGNFVGQASTVASVGTNLQTVNYENISAQQTVEIKWTVRRNDDESCFDEITKTISNNNFAVSAGNNRNTECGDDFVVLEGTVPDGYSGVWTCSNKDVKFSSNTDDTEGSTTQGSTRIVKAFGLSNSTAGNVFTWTVTNDNCSTNPSATVTIFNSTPVAKLYTTDHDNCDPTITLSAYPLESGVETGVWSGPALSYSPSTMDSPTTVVSNLTYGTLDFTWTVTRTINGISCQSDKTVSINNKSYTAKIDTKPADIDKCVRNISLVAQASPDKDKIIGTWSSTNSTVDALMQNNSDLHNNSITIEDIPQGTITFKWTLDDGDGGCKPSPAEITFTNEQVNAHAGDYAIFCSDEGKLQAQQPNEGSNGVWTRGKDTPATVTISNSNNYFTSVSNLVEGANEFIWTVTNKYGDGENDKCTDSESVTIYNHGFTAVAENRNDNKVWNICGTSDYLSANAPVDGNGKWTWDGGADAVTVDDPTSNATKITLADNTSNLKFTWTETRSYTHTLERGTVTKECEKTDYVTVYNRKPVVDDLTTYKTCNGSVQLHGKFNNAAVETGVWSKPAGTAQFGDADADVSTTGVADVIVNGIPNANKITLTWTVSSTEMTSCSTQKSVSAINYGFKPTATTANPVVCAETAKLTGSVPSMEGYKGYWGLAPEATALQDASATSVYEAELAPGKNSFTWSVVHPDYADCISSASVEVTNLNPGETTVPESVEVCIPEGTNYTITASKSNDIDVKGVWSTTTNGTIAAADETNESLTFPIKRDKNTFVWTVYRGNGNVIDQKCNVVKEVTITNNYVKPEVVQTEFISCGDEVTLKAKDVRTVYGNDAVGYWSTESTTASFSKTDANVKRGVDNAFETVVYNAGNGDVFYWNVSKNGKCGTRAQATVTSYEVAAEIQKAPKYVCEDNEKITLLANSLESMSDYARGEWTCIDAPSGVDPKSIVITNSDKSEATTTGLNVKGAYTFQWKTWQEIDGKRVCETKPVTTIVNNDKRTAEAVTGNKTGLVAICENTYKLSATEPETGFIGTWTKIQGDDNFIADSELHKADAILNVSDNSTAKVKWTIAPDPAVAANEGRCSAESIISVANYVVTPTVVLDAPVCDEAGTANLTASYSTVGTMTGTWSKVAAEAEGSFTASDNSTATYTGITKGNSVDLMFTLRNTVNGKYCDKSATITVTNDYYTFTAGDNDVTACSDEYDLKADVLGPKAVGAWTKVDGLTFTSSDETKYPDGINDPHAHIKGLSNVTPTTLTWTVKNGACASTVTIANNTVEAPVINNKETGVLCYNDFSSLLILHPRLAPT